MQLQLEHSGLCGGSRHINEVQEDKVQFNPQAAESQGLGAALHELSCTAPYRSWDSYRAVVLDVQA